LRFHLYMLINIQLLKKNRIFVTDIGFLFFWNGLAVETDQTEIATEPRAYGPKLFNLLYYINSLFILRV